MVEEIKLHLETINKMYYNEKLEYAFKTFYEVYNKNPYLTDCFFLIIAHLISNYNLTLDTDKVKEISVYDKKIIVDSAYQYVYEDVKSLRGPILNLFGEVLDSEVPYVKPYIDLIKMLSHNHSIKKQ